jgi:very-short-patch-repair endonuclease
MNETGFSWIIIDISTAILQKQELFNKLDSLKKSLQFDYDDLQKYDQRKGLLTNLQREVLEACKSKLLGEADWKKMLEQEFYLNWIQFIEKDNQVLRMQPFEIYSDNCSRLSTEVRNHRELTKLNISNLIFESTLEELIYDRLRGLGYEVSTQVGYSGYRIDLAIVHPDDPSRYILGIECDGAMFHSAKSTRERDVTRQEFLQNRGWIIERIWSTNWWRNPDREIERIKKRVEILRSEPVGKIKKE